MPVYLHQPGSAVVVPLQGWRGRPVTLDPGQVKTVHAAFPVSELAATPGDSRATSARGPSSVPARCRSARPPAWPPASPIHGWSGGGW